MVAVGISPQLLNIVWCNAAVVVAVVLWSRSCGVAHLV